MNEREISQQPGLSAWVAAVLREPGTEIYPDKGEISALLPQTVERTTFQPWQNPRTCKGNPFAHIKNLLKVIHLLYVRKKSSPPDHTDNY